MQKAPLQTYASALVFSPRESQIRKANLAHYPTWFKYGPVMEDHWGPELQTLEGHKRIVRAVAFSFDSKYLASQSDEFEIILWETMTGTPHSTLLEGIDSRDGSPSTLDRDACPSYLTFSRSGHLASVSSYREVRVWEPVTGFTCCKIVHGEHKEVQALALAADGALAISYPSHWSNLSETCIYRDGSLLISLETKLEVKALYFLSGGTLALVGSEFPKSTYEILLYDPETHAERRIPNVAFDLVAFSSNDQVALFSWDGGSITVYDLKQESCRTLEWGEPLISVMAFSISNRGLFLGCDDGSTHYWDLQSCTKTFILAYSGPIVAIAPSSDGRLAIALAYSREIRILRFGSESPSPNGDIALASASAKREGLHVISLPPGRENPVQSIVFSRDGKQLAYVTFRDIHILDSASRRELSLFHSGNTYSITISGNFFASGHSQGIVRVRDLASGRLLELRQHHADIFSAVAFSPDNTILVSVNSHGAAEFWDSNTWSLQHTMSVLGNDDWLITSVAFSQNGKRVAFLTSFSLSIWDAEQYICLQDFGLGFPLHDVLHNQIISFADESYIDTTFGRVRLDQSLIRDLRVPGQHMWKVEDARWRVTDHWLFRDGQKLLWLPHAFRPSCMARYGDLLVLGHRSGKMTFFDCNTNDSTSEHVHQTDTPDSRSKGKRKAQEYLLHPSESARKNNA